MVNSMLLDLLIARPMAKRCPDTALAIDCIEDAFERWVRVSEAKPGRSISIDLMQINVNMTQLTRDLKRWKHHQTLKAT